MILNRQRNVNFKIGIVDVEAGSIYDLKANFHSLNAQRSLAYLSSECSLAITSL